MHIHITIQPRTNLSIHHRRVSEKGAVNGFGGDEGGVDHARGDEYECSEYSVRTLDGRPRASHRESSQPAPRHASSCVPDQPRHSATPPALYTAASKASSHDTSPRRVCAHRGRAIDDELKMS